MELKPAKKPTGSLRFFEIEEEEVRRFACALGSGGEILDEAKSD